MITARLVLQEQFPEKQGVCSDEDFSRVESVRLVGRGFQEIDNLDLFDRLKELDLSNNRIRRVENISHLLCLDALDLSGNLIDEEGLFAEALPSNLRVLNLSGNPCAENSNARDRFCTKYPNVSVLFDLPSSHSKGGPEDTQESKEFPVAHKKDSKGILDSEAVLREVVDRKCRLQSISNLNISSTIHDLEREYDTVTMISKNRKQTQSISGEDSSPSDLTSEHLPMYEEKLSELKAKHDELSKDRGEFFEKLRAESLKKYEEKIRECKEQAVMQADSNAKDSG